MKTYRPIRSNHLSQGFGENRACIDPNTGRLYGKRGTCPAGTTEFYKYIGMKGHNGLDFGTWHGEPLYFPVDIPVEWWVNNEKDMSGGIGLNVISKEKVTVGNRTDYIKFKFWHLKSTVLNDGDSVVLGQLMGYCDNTGASSGGR